MSGLIVRYKIDYTENYNRPDETSIIMPVNSDSTSTAKNSLKNLMVKHKERIPQNQIEKKETLGR